MTAALNFRRITLLVVAFGLLLIAALAIPARASADGIFIPAPERVDGVFSPDNRLVYISAGDRVLRYDLQTQSILEPFVLGGRLYGMDLSPDGKTLAVADTSYGESQIWIHLVDVATGASRKVYFPREYYEGGTYAVAYGSDGRLLISSTYLGSGWAPLRRHNPATGETNVLFQVRQDTMLSASADRSVIGYAEANISSGDWGLYTVATEAFRKSGTGWFVYEIAVSRNGEQAAVPTYGGTFVYDGNLTQIKTLGEYASGQPIGVAYHPTKDLLYTAWVNSTEVRAFDATNFQQTESFDVDHRFENNGNWAFTNGRLRLSQDGSLLLATVKDGVRVLRTTSTATETQISASAGSVVSGGPVTFTATVKRVAPESGAPTGPVTFYRLDQWNNQVAIGTAQLDGTGKATITTTTLPIGTNKVYARYGGSLDDRSSQSGEVAVEVKRAPTVTRVSVNNPAPVYGESITVTVTITKTGGSVSATVELRDETQYLRSVYVSSGVGTVVMDGFYIGQHCLTAKYYGDLENEGSESEPACFEVGRADTRVEIEATLRPGGGGNVATLDVVVRPVAPGSGQPSGKVELSLGNLVLGSTRLDSMSHATLTVLGLSEEPQIIRVEYQGEARFKPSSGALPVGALKRQYLPFAVRGGPGE